MERMEIITRTERRRIYSEAEKAAVVAEASAPGATVRDVSRRLGIAESLIYNWRSTQRKVASMAPEPLQFISYGATPTSSVEPPALPSAMTMAPMAVTPPAEKPATLPEDLIRPRPGVRPGSIDIVLPSGVQLSVDSYINEKALARVLRALGQMA